LQRKKFNFISKGLRQLENLTVFANKGRKERKKERQTFANMVRELKKEDTFRSSEAG